MITFDNTLFYVGHVSSASDARKQNYEMLRSRLSQHMTELDSYSSLVDSAEDAEKFRSEFPSFKINYLKHPTLYSNNIFRMDDGYGNVFTDCPFPRWYGEVGLLLSVWRGLRKFLESDAKYLLWLEDDVSVIDNFADVFPLIGSYVDFDFDILTLSTRDDQLGIFDAARSASGNSELFEFGNVVFCKSFQLYWAGSIVISRAGAERILHDFETFGFVYPWDWYIFNVRSAAASVPHLRSFSIKPSIVRPFVLDLSISPDSTIVKDSNIEHPL